jgi:hypothetical protein
MRILYAFTVFLMFLVLISCQKEEFTPPGKPGGPSCMETGALQLDIGWSLRVNEVTGHLKSEPRTESFRVNIYREDGTLEMAFDSVAVMPDTIELAIGNYYAEAHSANNLPAAFENPYYFGTSAVFSIVSNNLQSVTVNCELANSIVSVLYSSNVMDGFSDYTTTVSSDLDSLVFAAGETRWGYFKPLPLDIRVELTWLLSGGTDTTRVLTGQIPDPLPNRHYEILVDATVNSGIASFQVVKDFSEVMVEALEISDHSPGVHNGGTGYGDLLITEIMNNPDTLSDTEGEWFELYNNSLQAINLQNLILDRDGNYRHTITDSIILQPGEYYVVERTAAATGVTNAYVYGSDISLTNTGAVLSIFNEGTEETPGSLIFSVDYGAAGFPVATGASLSLNPAMLNASDALLGPSWCTSTSAYSTGDLGTPGMANDPCQ